MSGHATRRWQRKRALLPSPLPPALPWFTCGHCSAWEQGAPPHDGGPCPAKRRADDSYVAMCDAQRMLAIRQAYAIENALRRPEDTDQ